LHDAVEDTETTFEELEQSFGRAVADLVREVTDEKSLSKSVRKESQILKASQVSAGAKQIKLADKIANIRDIGSVRNFVCGPVDHATVGDVKRPS
jgi:(p)ppGpp synthase/HD superfamily hydrolase